MGHWLSINNPAPPLIRPLRWATRHCCCHLIRGQLRLIASTVPSSAQVAEFYHNPAKRCQKSQHACCFLKIMTNHFFNNNQQQNMLCRYQSLHGLPDGGTPPTDGGDPPVYTCNSGQQVCTLEMPCPPNYYCSLGCCVDGSVVR
jgi:hypothetical protein